ERHLLSAHELLDFDGLRGSRVGLLDVFGGHNDILPLIVLNTLDDVFGLDLLAGTLIDAPISDRIHRAPIQPVEIDARVGGGGMQAHGNMNQSECNGAFPDGAGGHECSSITTGTSRAPANSPCLASYRLYDRSIWRGSKRRDRGAVQPRLRNWRRCA